MKDVKSKAIQYRNKGYSYSEISKILSLPKSTLSYWLRDIQLSNDAKNRINNLYTAGYKKGLLKKSLEQTKSIEKKYKNVQIAESSKIKYISKENLKFIGLALYWGEGYKKLKTVKGKNILTHPVSLTNSDPNLIKIYLKFLKEGYDVNPIRIRASIRCYQNQNYNDILNFWITTTKIHKSQFTKPYFGVSKASLRKKDKNTLPYGTLRVDVYDTELFHKIIGSINGVKNLLS